MKLPLKQRADLAKRLLDSLDKVDQNEHWEIWADEAERRYRAHRAGKMSARPVEDLMRELRAELRRHAS